MFISVLGLLGCNTFTSLDDAELSNDMSFDMVADDMNDDLATDLSDMEAEADLGDMDERDLQDIPVTECGYSRCRVTLEAVPNGPLGATVSLAAVGPSGVITQSIPVNFGSSGLNLGASAFPGDPGTINLSLDAFTRTLSDGSPSFLITGDNEGDGNVANYYFNGSWRPAINGFDRRERSFGGVTVGGPTPLVATAVPSKHVWLDQVSQTHAVFAAFDVELTDAALQRSEDTFPATPSKTRVRASEGTLVAVGTEDSLLFWDSDSNAFIGQTPAGLTPNIDTFAFTRFGDNYLAAHKSAVQSNTVEMGTFDVTMGFVADRTSVASRPLVELDVDPFLYRGTDDAVLVGAVSDPGQGYLIEFFLYLPDRPASQPVDFQDGILLESQADLFAFDFQVVRNDPVGIVISIWDSQSGLNAHYIEEPTM